jgi:hypothetical protein
MPKKAQFTLQATGILAGNPLDSRTHSQHEEPSHVFTASEPMMRMHCYMIQSSDPHTYNKALGNPLWQAAMQKEYNSLLENQTWDLVPLPGVDGSTRSRGTRLDKFPKDFIRSIKISTSSRRLSVSRIFRLCGIVLE